MEVQFEGNSSEEEVDGLCNGAVKGGSSGVRAEHGMRLVLKLFSKITRAKMLQYNHLNLDPHAREKINAECV